MSFEGIILEYFENLRRQLEARPMILGAISASGGGLGTRPGGYIGFLPQTQVAYDYTEGATITTSGIPSVLDNLNHIRYRLEVLESIVLTS